MTRIKNAKKNVFASMVKVGDAIPTLLHPWHQRTKFQQNRTSRGQIIAISRFGADRNLGFDLSGL